MCGGFFIEYDIKKVAVSNANLRQPLFYVPPDRVLGNREPCMCKAASYLMLYCSQRPYIPVETSQSRRMKGGLQTTIDLYFGFLYSNVGFYARISPVKQDLLFLFGKKK